MNVTVFVVAYLSPKQSDGTGRGNIWALQPAWGLRAASVCVAGEQPQPAPLVVIWTDNLSVLGSRPRPGQGSPLTLGLGELLLHEDQAFLGEGGGPEGPGRKGAVPADSAGSALGSSPLTGPGGGCVLRAWNPQPSEAKPRSCPTRAACFL